MVSQVIIPAMTIPTQEEDSQSYSTGYLLEALAKIGPGSLHHLPTAAFSAQDESPYCTIPRRYCTNYLSETRR